jgi:hypothetical protein
MTALPAPSNGRKQRKRMHRTQSLVTQLMRLAPYVDVTRKEQVWAWEWKCSLDETCGLSDVSAMCLVG